MMVRDEVTEVERGDALVLNPGSRFLLATPERPYRGIAVNLPAGAVPWAAGPSRVCRLDDRAFRLATYLESVLEDPDAGSAPLLEHLGLGLCHAVRGLVPPEGPVDGLVVEAQLRIRANLGSPEPLAAVLAGIGASYRQLARRFAAVTGQSPKAWQLGLRLREAERLLAETDLTVTAIALELGFPSSQHFSTLFRRRTGDTPTAYRKRAA